MVWGALNEEVIQRSLETTKKWISGGAEPLRSSTPPLLLHPLAPWSSPTATTARANAPAAVPSPLLATPDLAVAPTAVHLSTAGCS